MLIDADGREHLDAVSGVFVAILGYSPHGVADAIAEQMARLPFAYSGQFSNEAEDRLARLLIDRAPPGMAKVWLTTSGAAANETALKLARQHHLLRGNAGKTAVIARRHSYHGATIGALSMTGTPPRRRPYLFEVPHVAPPYCYRCPFEACRDTCGLRCADEVEEAIRTLGAEAVSAVIVEPVAGAPLGALVSDDAYLRRLRTICDRHDVLLIADEIVSGMGRTGTWFAIERSGVAPDIVTLAKGLGAGFVPAGAVLASDRVVEPFERSGTAFVHGESFTGHPVTAAAGVAVIEHIERHGLLARIARLEPMLAASLDALRAHPIVGDVRGRGLLFGLELIRDRATKAPFERGLAVAERVVSAAGRRGVLLLAGSAAADGENGDTVIVSPPYILSEQQIERIARVMSEALDEVAETHDVARSIATTVSSPSARYPL